MTVVVRLIIALAFVLQSMPWIAVDRCTLSLTGSNTAGPWSNTVGTSALEGDAECPCCALSQNTPIDCDVSEDLAACCCEHSGQRSQSPPPNQSNERLQHFAAMLPSTFRLTALMPRWRERHIDRRAIALKCSATSIQSVLCMWTV